MYKLIIAVFGLLILGGCMSSTEKSNKLPESSSQKSTNNQMLPPKYLSIEGFKDCLSTQTEGSAQYYCMPSEKPANCSTKAWEELNKLEGSEKIPTCKK